MCLCSISASPANLLEHGLHIVSYPGIISKFGLEMAKHSPNYFQRPAIYDMRRHVQALLLDFPNYPVQTVQGISGDLSQSKPDVGPVGDHSDDSRRFQMHLSLHHGS
ncbi:unnamed protein product [Boreogadus saida]